MASSISSSQCSRFGVCRILPSELCDCCSACIAARCMHCADGYAHADGNALKCILCSTDQREAWGNLYAESTP